MDSQYNDDLNLLYGGPFGDFVQRRTFLARALRKVGKRSEASFVQKLTKPAFSAWLVNHLYLNQNALFQGLLEAGDGLRQAQKEVLPGQGLSSLQRARLQVQKAVNSLLGTAREETLHMQRSFTAQTQRRFTRTLEAIAQAPRESFDPPLGRFVEDLMPAGFDTVLELAASLPRPAKTGKKKAARSSTARRVPRLPPPTRVRLEKRVLQARDQRDRARREMKATSRSLQGLVQKQRHCSKEMDTLADQLSVLKKEIRQIESRLDSARGQHDRRARRLERAERELIRIVGDDGGGDRDS